MKRYSPEFKESVVRKMMPPENVPIMRLSEESGVSYVTLAKWRDEVRGGGEAAPGNGERPDRWSSEDKFLIVLETLLETHSLNAAEGAVFCKREILKVAKIFPQQGGGEFCHPSLRIRESLTRLLGPSNSSR